MTQAKSVLAGFLRPMLLLALPCVLWSTIGLAQGKFPAGAYANGQFVITFLEDGSHTVSADGNVVVKGSYSVTQDQILLTDKSGEYACGATQTGKYKWKVVEKTLTFEKVDDECDGRAGALTGEAWTKK
ncbi:MAG: hypothetical protein ABI882_11420 [Acidobacteriota bacterium]